MEPILKFLKDKFELTPVISEPILVSKHDLDIVNNLFTAFGISKEASKYFKIRPRLEKNQIWTVKTEYEDFLGHVQKSSHPLLIIINSEPDDIEEEDFIRVYLISPFPEFAINTDEVCQDASIIGFPFFIEKWNDQPMLSEILDEYLGYYEPKYSSSKFDLQGNINDSVVTPEIESLNNSHREFRDIEVSKAKYLTNSIFALLNFLENKQSQDAGAAISFSDKTEYPKFFIGQNLKEPSYALAARSGIDTDDKYLLYKNPTLAFELFIRKNEDGFILTVKPFQKVKLIYSGGEEMTGISNSEKSVFSNLGKGLYYIISEQIQEPIKIRLK